jgi:predicted DCC family thiol-disulfide oxidoreductase YuxK
MRTVAWFRRHDRHQRFFVVPFQETPDPPLTPKRRARAERAIVVVTRKGRFLSAGRAVLFALEEIGWHPALMRLARHRPFVWFVELGYWIVARNRPFFDRVVFRR